MFNSGHFSRFYNSTFNTFSRRNHLNEQSIDLQRLALWTQAHTYTLFARLHIRQKTRRNKNELFGLVLRSNAKVDEKKESAPTKRPGDL